MIARLIIMSGVMPFTVIIMIVESLAQVQVGRDSDTMARHGDFCRVRAAPDSDSGLAMTSEPFCLPVRLIWRAVCMHTASGPGPAVAARRC